MSVGDRISITVAPWKGEQGIVESINGYYHIVRRDGCFHPDDVVELYPNEIEALTP